MKGLRQVAATLLVWIVGSILHTSQGLFVCPSPCLCTEDIEGPGGATITRGPSLVVDCRKQGLAQLPPLDGLQGTPIFRLFLDRNEISTIPSHAFHKLQVDGIQLSDNPIVNISAEAFVGVKGLKYLSLRRTQLVSKPNLFLPTITELEALDLSEIKTGIFTKIKTAAFGDLPNLEQLLLKQNGITEIMPDAFIGLPAVFELRVEDNKLESIPEAFLTLTELKFLHLDNNPILRIDAKAFRTLLSLQTLTLSDTRLLNSSFIHPEAFVGASESLTALTLSINNLMSVPCDILSKLKNLSELKMSDAMVSDLKPGCFKDLDHLKLLDISGNKFKVVPDIFIGIEDSLETLLLARLNLNVDKMPETSFKAMKKLNELDLSGNSFPVIKTEVFRYVTAKHLSLSYCHIEMVEPDAFQGLKAPSVLDLNNNKIQNLTFLENKCQFEQVELFRNPVNCDCSFYHVVRYEITTFIGKCTGPQEYAGIKLDDFKSNADVRRECGTLSGVNDEILCFWQLPQTSEERSSTASSKALALLCLLLVSAHTLSKI